MSKRRVRFRSFVGPGAIWKPFSVAIMSRQMKDEEKIMREKMIQKIRNQTMGDVMFEHLKDSFGAELKVKDDGGASKSGSGVEGGAIKEKKANFTGNSSTRKKSASANVGSAVPRESRSTGRNMAALNNGSRGSADKPVATYTTKDGKKGTLTAAEFMKLQKAYTKYKIENTPRSFNKNAPAGTDYSKWDKFVNDLDEEEREMERVKNKENDKKKLAEMELRRQENMQKSKEIGSSVKVYTVIVSFIVTFCISVFFDIRSTFIKQVVFAIVAVICFFALLYDQQNGYNWSSRMNLCNKKKHEKRG